MLFEASDASASLALSWTSAKALYFKDVWCGVSFSCFYMMLHDMFKLEKRMNLIAKTAKQNADEKIVLPDMVAHWALGIWHLAHLALLV